MSTPDLFRSRLNQMIDLRHPLAVLSKRLPWASLEAAMAPKLARTQKRHDKNKLYALHAPEVE